MAEGGLPMFPLGTVLFPHTAIPLHVFEPRYRALTGYCLEHDRRLGIVLIERGSEVGGGDIRFGVGTQGVIAQASALPDGRWLIAVVGERRIRIDRWLGEEPFPRAQVTPLDEEAPTASSEAARDHLLERVRRYADLASDLEEWPAGFVPEVSEDPALVAWQVGGLGLLGPVDCQRLLETDGVDARLRLLAALLDEEITVLALRAEGG
ncbi:MAG: LON peptidase substrate-binding domain-containing protein [Actinomycetota bacterium]|nr:LON peptidase substrate-binding domain-containing protein [Actinomycetota bacterium]